MSVFHVYPSSSPPRMAIGKLAVALGVRIRQFAPDALSPALRGQIWGLFSRYNEVDRAVFEGLLAGATEVVTLWDGEELVGLLAAHVWDSSVDGTPVRVGYLSCTVFDERVRGAGLLQRVGFGLWLRHGIGARRLYLLAKMDSYKSYLALMHTFPGAWPRHDRPTPDAERGLLDGFAARVFGATWDAVRGVTTYSGTRKRPGVASVPDTLDADPHVRFFLARNPRHDRGEGLGVLARIGMVSILAMFGQMIARMVARA